jgi:hypothetical protein
LPVQLPTYEPGGDPGAAIERAACANVTATIRWAEAHGDEAAAGAYTFCTFQLNLSRFDHTSPCSPV